MVLLQIANYPGITHSFRIIFCSKLTGLSLPSLDLSSVTPGMMAVTLSAGPVILAQTMANFTDKTKRSIFYPFHKVGDKQRDSEMVIFNLAFIYQRMAGKLLVVTCLSLPWPVSSRSSYWFTWPSQIQDSLLTSSCGRINKIFPIVLKVKAIWILKGFRNQQVFISCFVWDQYNFDLILTSLSNQVIKPVDVHRW